jgi:hypothetical protein
MQERLLSRDSEIEHLKLLVAKLRRKIFVAKSERDTRDRAVGAQDRRTGFDGQVPNAVQAWNNDEVVVPD